MKTELKGCKWETVIWRKKLLRELFKKCKALSKEEKARPENEEAFHSTER